MLEHKPHHVRKKIAFISTAFVALVLLTLMVLHYTKPKPHEGTQTGSRLKAFYTSISDSTQSLFDRK